MSSHGSRRRLSAESTFIYLRALFTLFILGAIRAFSKSIRSGIPAHHLQAFDTSRNSHLALLQRATVEEDLATILQRRASTIVGSLGIVEDVNIPAWLSTLNENGKWPDSEVDYTTGCEARRASWPAHWHWKRIVSMAGAWHGGVPNTDPKWDGNDELRAAISRAMGYWFSRDMGNATACMDRGGTTACPCSNSDNTLWNQNWFSNIILVPRLVAEACVLLRSPSPGISSSESASCIRITSRTARIATSNINGLGVPTGANTLDIAKISVDAGLLAGDGAMVREAYERAHGEMRVRDQVKADGIRGDGSFSQHGGMLYNGNYGKDYSNAVLDLEIAAAGTQFEAGDGPLKAFETLVEGNKWMIFFNTVTKVMHWDYSALGRMITFPAVDDHATRSIRTNVSAVAVLGSLWSSNALQSFASDLSTASSSANLGRVVGNRMFCNNDYMVHRGAEYVSTVKMYSSRTTSTNCINNQNMKGFHIADGTLYTYHSGNEYEDIFASWDWDLIPGTTVDYRHTPLTCETTTHTGVEPFVGGLSDGQAGLSAMRYANPVNGALKFQKAWFFLESGVHHVMVNVLQSTSDAPVYSVLDQKRRSGGTKVDWKDVPVSEGFAVKGARWLWHNNVGYVFPSEQSMTLQLRMGEATGDWAEIGASTQPPKTVDLWASWLEHDKRNVSAPLEYSFYPGATYVEFQQRARSEETRIGTSRNTGDVSATHDQEGKRVLAVFWQEDGGSFVVTPQGLAPLTVSSDNAVAMILSLEDGSVHASDPAQTLRSATLSFEFRDNGQLPSFWTGDSRRKSVEVIFPTGGSAGSAVQASLRTTGNSDPEAGGVDGGSGQTRSASGNRDTAGSRLEPTNDDQDSASNKFPQDSSSSGRTLPPLLQKFKDAWIPLVLYLLSFTL